VAQFCDYIVFNDKTAKRHDRIERHTVDLHDFFHSLPGFKKLYLINGDESHPHRFNGDALVAAVWVAPWGIDALMNAQYVELDGSFTVLQPFVYNVPQAILNNNAIPVGFSMGPTESCKLFEIFHHALIAYGMDAQRLKSLPVLSDEGLALRKYSAQYHDFHFFCYCHLIRKFGAGSPAALIAQRALYCSSLEEFMAELPQLASDLRVQLGYGIISQESYKSLCEFIGLETAADGSMTGNLNNFEHGLWKRALFGVSTCDNHAERFQGVLNKACDTRTTLSERLGVVQQEICKKFAKYGIDPNAQAKKHFRKLQKNSSNKPEECPPGEACCWSQIWSERYQAHFPCQHVYVPPELTIEFPQAALIRSFPDVPLHTELGDGKMRKWLSKILHRRSANDDRIQWPASNENLAGSSGDSTWMGHIRQVACELQSLGERSLPWEDLLIRVTAAYLSKCNEWQQDPENSNIEAKSEFRALLIKQLVK
jgi:hypothetical protein